jgi:hypothetical protein
VEVSGELAVVLFDQNLRGSLDGFSSDSAHCERIFLGLSYNCKKMIP